VGSRWPGEWGGWRLAGVGVIGSLGEGVTGGSWDRIARVLVGPAGPNLLCVRFFG